MSTIVKDINDAIEARLAAVLPSSYSELDYKVDVTKNNFRGNVKRYGVVPGDAPQSEATVTKAYTLDQAFTIKLTEGYINSGKNDSALREKYFDLYEQMHIVLKDLVNTKAGGASVIAVKDPSIDAFQELAEDKAVLLTSTVVVQYRQNLS